MTFVRISIAIATVAVFLFSCGQNDQAFTPFQPDLGLKILSENKISDRFTIYLFESPAIARNTIGELAQNRFSVYLPKSYSSDPNRTYPVVYGLHGYGDDAHQFITETDSFLDNAAEVPEVILVAINGTNSLSGSFYENSEITGRWLDMVANEVTYLVDQKFRTIKSSNGRMIAGFSMGGFGAWNIGLKRPDIFGYVWALCPGAFEPGGIKEGLVSWNGFGAFLPAYERVFAPNTSSDSPDYFSKLESGFGNIDQKISDYKQLNRPLKSIRIDYGKNDSFVWIPKGSEYLYQALLASGTKVNRQIHDDGHQFSKKYITEGLIPFLKESFK